MSDPMTCREAGDGVRRLRALARVVGLPPAADAELARLEAAVDAAAELVAERLADDLRAHEARRQPTLF